MWDYKTEIIFPGTKRDFRSLNHIQTIEGDFLSGELGPDRVMEKQCPCRGERQKLPLARRMSGALKPPCPYAKQGRVHCGEKAASSHTCLQEVMAYHNWSLKIQPFSLCIL